MKRLLLTILAVLSLWPNAAFASPKPPQTTIDLKARPIQVRFSDPVTLTWKLESEDPDLCPGDLKLYPGGYPDAQWTWPITEAAGSVTIPGKAYLPFVGYYRAIFSTKSCKTGSSATGVMAQAAFDVITDQLVLPTEIPTNKDQPPVTNSSDHDYEVKTATDPMEIHRGEFVLSRQDAILPGRGQAIDLNFSYSSRNTTDGPFGYGWDFSSHRRLRRLPNENVVVWRGNNRRDEFVFSAATKTYIAPSGIYETLIRNPDSTYTLTAPHGDKEVYDVNGNLIRMEDRFGNFLTFVYDPAGFLPIGKVHQSDNFVFGAVAWDYRLLRITSNANRTIEFSYNSEGRLATITYAGRTIRYGYDPATGDLLSVTTPATPEFPQGLTTRYAYTNHNLTSVTDPKSQTYLTNVYDPATDRVTQQTYGAGTSKLTYGKDATGNPTTEVTDRRGTRLLFTFDPAGHITRTERFTDGTPPDEPKSYVTTYEYNAAGERTRVVFPRGNSLESTYDAKGNLLELRRKKLGAAKGVADPSDLVTTLTYEPRFNLLKTVTDPRGNVTTYTYDYELGEDENGFLRRITGPTVDGLTPMTTFTYNRFGQVETVTDPTGLVTKSVYDPATGDLLSTTEGWGSGLAGTTRFTYDAIGNVLSATDPTRARTTFAYNALNQLTQTTLPGGLATVYAYDANGNLTQADRQAKDNKPGPRPALGTTNPTDDWQTTRYGYTTLDQLASLADDLSQTTGFAYDPNGNRSKIQNPKSEMIQFIYDERNLLWKTLDAATPSGMTESRYDANGNLAILTDAKGNSTSYAYDDFDRLTKTTYADGAFATYEYDAASNLSKIQNPKSDMIQFTYDALNRLREKVTPEGKTTYTYDPAGRLLTAISPTGTINLTYDRRGRVKTATSGGKKLTYVYDAAGNRTQLRHPDGFTVVSRYDALHRLTGLDFSATTLGGSTGGGGPEPFPYPSPSPSPGPLLTFGYDALSRRTSLSLPNGLVTRYGYDAVNRLLSLLVTRGRIALLTLGFTYDLLGNRLSQKADSATLPLSHFATYAYDTLSQLTSVTEAGTKTSYAYDPVGNRTTAAGQPYVPNRLNQYDAVGATTLRHDTNGNLTFDGLNVYACDSENRLIRSTGPSGAVFYAYDAFGRRVSKTVNNVTTSYLYDGDQLIADVDAAGKIIARYVYGPGLDEPLVMFKAGKPYYFYADALGSIIALTNERGELIERYTYDAFGTPTILAPDGQVRLTSIVGNRFMFTGREYDPETGLYYYRRRYYDPKTGKFTSRDPLGVLPDVNLYRYAGNNPVTWVDPWGLKVEVGERAVGPGSHTVIILTPDNGGPTTTLSAGPNYNPSWISPFFGVLVATPNNPADAPQNLRNIVQITDPHGRSDSQFIADILRSASKYQSVFPYDPTPWPLDPYYNSNSYVRGILQDVGVPNPTNPPNLQPGWDKPVPLVKKKK